MRVVNEPGAWVQANDLIGDNAIALGLMAVHELADGLITVADAWMLYRLARISNQSILELGTWRGKSTICLAKGLADRVPGNACDKVYTYDPHGWGKGGMPGNAAVALRHWWTFGVAERIVPVHGAVWDIDPPREIGLVFVDDNHVPDVLRADLEMVSGFAAGPIVVHDLDHADLRKIAHDTLLPRGWRSTDHWKLDGAKRLGVGTEVFEREQ